MDNEVKVSAKCALFWFHAVRIRSRARAHKRYMYVYEYWSLAKLVILYSTRIIESVVVVMISYITLLGLCVTMAFSNSYVKEDESNNLLL